MPDRTIMHIDMNAFFASVEQQSNPKLRGKPVAVIGSAKRTVITTASYEARKYGVKTGMTVYEGKVKCPDLILVVGNNRKYTHTSAGILEIMREFTPAVEVFSIDEAFLDLTGSLKLFTSPERIACLLKARIRRRFGLTCSIGIAPNKLLAKLASDMKKPDGLTIIKPADVRSILDSVPISDLCGIGSKMNRHLSIYGIKTCGDLGRFPVSILKKRFGVIGEKLHLMGLGIDETPVVPLDEAEEIKSVGHSMTLERDVGAREEILKFILQLSEMVGRRARKHGVQGKTVTLTIRYADFSTFSRQETRTGHTNRSDEIYRASVQILDSIILTQPVRLLGVRISNLRHQADQLPLFAEERKRVLVTGAMDSVNDRFGDFAVSFGSLLGEESGSKVISPAWRPEGARHVDVE